MRSRRQPISTIDTSAMSAHRASMAALARLRSVDVARPSAAAIELATAAVTAPASAPFDGRVVDLADARARRQHRQSRVG